MSDEEPRQPLRPPDAEARRKALADRGLGEDLLPLNLTDAEKQAAGIGPPDSRYWDSTKTLKENVDAKEKAMDVKPGWQTSEFWLKLAAGAAMALLAFTIDQGLPAIAGQLQGAGTVGALLLILVPVAKMGLGWLLQKLAADYSNNRTALKLAANDNGEAAPAKQAA